MVPAIEYSGAFERPSTLTPLARSSVDQVAVADPDHALAQPAAVLDLAAALVAADVLHQERHAAEGTVAEARLVEPADAIVIGLDDRVDRRIDRLDRARRRRRQLLRRDVPLAHQLGQAERVITAYSASFMRQPRGIF